MRDTRQSSTSKRVVQLYLGREQAPLRQDVTKAFSSRRPWGSEPTAFRATTHGIDPDRAAPEAPVASFAVRCVR